MNSKGGRQQLDRIQAHQANMLVQNHLSNSVGPPQPNPSLLSRANHQQLSMAAQQQLAPLQQQQQEQQLAQAQAQAYAMQQSVQGFPQGMVPNQHMINQQIQNSQLNPQLQAQIRLQQLAQANLARQPGQTPNATQAQVLARAQQAQYQLLQARETLGLPQPEQGTGNFGSSRPVQQPQMQANGGQRIPPDKVAQIKARLARLSTMNDQQREALFQQVSTPKR